jgi:hypothetical protein
MDKLGGLLDATRSDLSALDTEAQPDAVIWLQGGAAVAGAGFAWGHGQINHKFSRHSFSISGLSVANVRVASISATGLVMGLGKLSNFGGSYSRIWWGPDATALGDDSATYLKNERDVVIKLVATDAGLRFRLSVNGVRVKLIRPDVRRNELSEWY